MKIRDLRVILAEAAELYSTAGKAATADALRKFADALATHDAKTVDAFVKSTAQKGVS